jgi:3-methyl-2-oxobutanoate hydroxymethyltransferase
MKINDFSSYKKQQRKISMVTCYDYTSAKILANSSVDCILVGDSAAMTMHGFQNTVSATLDMMSYHVAAVYRGAPHQFIIGDLPFLSYRKDLKSNVEAAGTLIQAGAQAVKLEGADGNLELIQHLVKSGIPVMGHLGLTPQSVHQLSGYKVQGKTEAAAAKLLQDALDLEKAGCFSIVLECIPRVLAKEITQALSIPTIGIGAGPQTDGQVLVWQDLLGFNSDFKAKFVKIYLEGQDLVTQALNQFTKEVNSGEFPNDENCY